MKTETAMPLFDRSASFAAAEAGIAQASENKASLLRHAKRLAVEIAERQGVVTADDVAFALKAQQISINALGNAAGGLFKGGQFEWTGRFVKSTRVASHGNLLREWSLKK